jgi:5-oxoprolinase (ATP-hydrolysing) subunit A
VESIDPKLILFAPDKSELARAGEARGLQVAREIFADRNYLNTGWLVPRTRPDALLHDPTEAAERVLRMLREGKVRSIEGRDVEVRGETICVHGDTPGAVEFARELRTRLEQEGVRIMAPQTSR